MRSIARAQPTDAKLTGVISKFRSIPGEGVVGATAGVEKALTSALGALVGFVGAVTGVVVVIAGATTGVAVALAGAVTGAVVTADVAAVTGG